MPTNVCDCFNQEVMSLRPGATMAIVVIRQHVHFFLVLDSIIRAKKNSVHNFAKGNY
jgi:hypothetical protein